MPKIKSAKKALRQNRRRRARNLERQRRIKEAIKNFRKVSASGKTEETRAALSKVYQALDKAAKTGYLKKNKASRLKSRLSRKLKNQ